MNEDITIFEALGYRSASAPPEVKQTSNPVIRPETRVNKADNVRQPKQSGVPVLAADVNGKLLGEAGLIALNEHIKQNYKPTQRECDNAMVEGFEHTKKQPECKHNWAKKGNGKVCIECGEQPNTELLIVKTIQGLMHVIVNNLEKLPNEALRRMALDDVGIFEAGVLYKLQEKYA